MSSRLFSPESAVISPFETCQLVLGGTCQPNSETPSNRLIQPAEISDSVSGGGINSTGRGDLSCSAAAAGELPPPESVLDAAVGAEGVELLEQPARRARSSSVGMRAGMVEFCSEHVLRGVSGFQSSGDSMDELSGGYWFAEY